MKREHFIQCAEAIRSYALWERALYKCSIDLDPTPITGVLDVLGLAMGDFDGEWAYDNKLGFNWIVEWTFGESDAYYQERHGKSFDLTDAGALYDFLVFMNEHGWED
jgi:hypothetical protein